MMPILVGLHNPYSSNPRNALAPGPRGSAGYRLWRTMWEAPDPVGVARLARDHTSCYMASFDRRNLITGEVPTYITSAYKLACAGQMLPTFPKGSTVVLLGSAVAESFSPLLSSPLQKIYMHPQVIDGWTWRCLPHPSGRSPLYNDPVMRTLVGMVLCDVLSAAQEQQHDATQ